MANDFLPFCPTDTGTNLLSQGAYAVATGRTSGNQPGVASSQLNNKALRQANVITSQLASFLSTKSGASLLDDGSLPPVLGVITAMLTPIAPVVQTFTASGTYNRTYVFFIASGSATAGATYTNNGVTFTVVETVASGTQLVARGNNVPAVSGTLTKSGGTGDATLTFYAYRMPVAVEVTVTGGGGGSGGNAGTAGGQVAAGAGGGGGGTAIKTIRSGFGVTETVTVGAAGAAGSSGANAGGSGGTSSFGAHVSATGGAGGAGSSAGAGTQYFNGGDPGVGSSGDINFKGGAGGPGFCGAGSLIYPGTGGTSYFSGTVYTAGTNSVAVAGQSYGGGAGGPSSIASQSAKAGAAGVAGVVIIRELYQ